MDSRSVIFGLFLAVTVMSLGHQGSARPLSGDAYVRTRSLKLSKDLEPLDREYTGESSETASHRATGYQNLEEIDRLRLSINHLICGTMEEGCDLMDDAGDHADFMDPTTESFATLNLDDHVMEY